MNRRTFINTTGMSLLASSAYSSTNASGQQVKSAKNLVIFTSEYGYHDKHFLPQTDDLGSSELLKILAPHHNDLTVFNKTAQPEIGNGHANHRGLLSLKRKHRGGNETSLDKFIADRLVQKTRYKSVHMGDKNISIDGDGRLCQSWLGKTTKFIYDKLFEDVSMESLTNESLFMQGLARSNKQHASYSHLMDKINDSFALRQKWLTAPFSKPSRAEKKALTAEFYTADVHKRGYATPLKQYFDLVLQGLLHKRGQVFVVSAPATDKSTARTGASVGFHSATHNNGKGMEDVIKYESYMFNGLADFINELKKNNLLDETMVLVLGGLNNAGAHVRETIPTVLVGGGLQHQGVVQCQEKEALKYPLANVYVSVLHQMEIDVNEFAGIQGNVDHIINS